MGGKILSACRSQHDYVARQNDYTSGRHAALVQQLTHPAIGVQCGWTTGPVTICPNGVFSQCTALVKSETRRAKQSRRQQPTAAGSGCDGPVSLTAEGGAGRPIPG